VTDRSSIQAWELAEQIARAYYLRTGAVLDTSVFLAEIERKFNPYHDPGNGQFTFGPGGSGAAGNRAAMGERPRPVERPHPVRHKLPEPGRSQVNRTGAAAGNRQPAPMRFSHSQGIDLPTEVIAKANSLSDSVYLATGRRIHVTSGRRPPHRQASAMYDNYRNDTHPPTYANRVAEAEVHRAFQIGQKNKLSRDQTVLAMTIILEKQVQRGVYLSPHMRSNAIDIRMPSPRVLQVIHKHPSVKRVGVENDHIHIQFH
jgi:hypothetical protein